MLRAVQTASIIAAPHGLTPIRLEELTECGAAGWESPPDMQQRVNATFEDLLLRHVGHALLVVAHSDVNRIYLASLLGLPADQACQMQVDNCAISVIARVGERTTVSTLNAAFHLTGIAA